MSQGANVEDLDVFRYVKTALIKFKQAADASLVNADAQAARTLQWLEGEQITHWQTQIRKRQELVGRCRDAVRSKKLFTDSTGRRPSAYQEEKQLAAALKLLEEAEQKLASTKRHIPMLQKEFEAYRGGVQGLGSLLTSELPKAIAMLEKLSGTINDYVNLSSPAPATGTEPSSTPLPAGQMNRGGESADAAQPPSAPEPPAKGDDHVTG